MTRTAIRDGDCDDNDPAMYPNEDGNCVAHSDDYDRDGSLRRKATVMTRTPMSRRQPPTCMATGSIKTATAWTVLTPIKTVTHRSSAAARTATTAMLVSPLIKPRLTAMALIRRWCRRHRSRPDEDGFLLEGDCDDSDPSVYPGADDSAGDGVDQNYDGVDGVDADHGFASTNGGGGDCDDNDRWTRYDGSATTGI